MDLHDDPTIPRPPEDGEDSMADVLGGFPRHLTTQLIEEGAERESRRQLIGVWVLAAALTLFALAHPSAPGAWGATFARPVGALGLDAWPAAAGSLQRSLESLLGAHLAEQLRLLLSAVAYGLCLPATFAITRRFGAEFGLRLAVGLVALLGAGAWIAGTDPAGGAVALLFALELFRRTWNAPPGLRVRALVGLGLFALVVPVLGWLLPAILLAGLDGTAAPRAKRRRATLAGAVVVTVLLLGWWGLRALADVSVWPAIGLAAPHGAGPEGPGLPGGLLGFGRAAGVWTLGALASLGVATVGLAALPLLRRGEAEERPPAWLLLWCLAPAAAALTSSPELAGFACLPLLPVALVGLMDLVARQDEAPARGLALLLFAVQAAGLAAVLALSGAERPLRRWQDEAIRTLAPGDLVVSCDPVHRELLARRWDLEVVAARPYGLTPGVEVAVERAWAAGRRVAIDAGSFRGGAGAALAAALAERGEVAVVAPPVGRPGLGAAPDGPPD